MRIQRKINLFVVVASPSIGLLLTTLGVIPESAVVGQTGIRLLAVAQIAFIGVLLWNADFLWED